MKRLLVPILMLLVLVQSFGRWIILAEFRMNQAWIAERLCENRSRPQLKCGGRCQLMKRMAEEDKAAAGSQGKMKFEEVAWPDGSQWYQPVGVGAVTLQHHSRYTCCFSDGEEPAPDRPPAA